jgi:hypothetical protein
MTQQEKQERSEQIALMLGWIYNSFNDRWNEDMSHDYSFLRMDELNFHSDWNWIMEAVEFIEKVGFYSKISGCATSICNYCWFDEGGDSGSFVNNRKVIGYNSKNYQNKKETVFIAVSDFAKIYNDDKIHIT